MCQFCSRGTDGSGKLQKGEICLDDVVGAPPIAAADIPDDTTTPAAVAVGGTYRGVLEGPGDRDWVAVDLATGQRVRIDLTSDTGGLDPYLRLHDAGGAQIAFDDDGGGGLNSRLTYTALQDERVYVSAGSYRDAGTGPYTIGITDLGTVPPPPPDAIPADPSTAATIAVGGTFDGRLEALGDRDWVRLQLDRGETVEITLEGRPGTGSLDDPYLRLYDGAGRLVAENDDAAGLDSRLVHTAPGGGTFFVSAAAYADNGTGFYRIAVEAVRPPTPLDSIDWGTALPSTSVTYHFAAPGTTFDGVTSDGFNAYERQQFRLAMDLIADLTNLEFNETANANAADFVLVLDVNELSPNLLGFFYPPGTSVEGVGVFNGAAWDRSPGGDLERGGFGFVTIVHELGHGLGLAHPHDRGGTSTIMDGVSNSGDTGTFDLNQGLHSTMSYNSGWVAGPPGTGPFFGGSYGFEGGPMAFDVALLQEKYGADPDANAGDTTYVLPEVNGTGTFFELIYDTGGYDTIRHDGTDPAIIDLRDATLMTAAGGGGYLSSVRGIAGGVTIANGTGIERAIGGARDDLLRGNGLDNRLNGGPGADRMVGFGGDDIYSVDRPDDAITEGAGNGTDTILASVSYDLPENVEVLRLTGPAAIDGGGNNLDNFIVGNDAANHLRGRSGDDTIHGRGAMDVLNGGPGADVLKGQIGNDRLFGGDGDDVLFGDEGIDILNGGAGADLFRFTGDFEADRIFDFEDGVDLIDLSFFRQFDGGGPLSVDQLRVVQQGDHVRVELDLDRDGKADVADYDGDGQDDSPRIYVLNADVADFQASDFVL